MTTLSCSIRWIAAAAMAVLFFLAGCGSAKDNNSTSGVTTTSSGTYSASGDFQVTVSTPRSTINTGDSYTINITLTCVQVSRTCGANTGAPLAFYSRPTSFTDTVAMPLSLTATIATTNHTNLCADTCDKAGLYFSLAQLAEGTLDNPATTSTNEFSFGQLKPSPISITAVGVAKAEGAGRAIITVTIDGSPASPTPMQIQVPIDIVKGNSGILPRDPRAASSSYQSLDARNGNQGMIAPPPMVPGRR